MLVNYLKIALRNLLKKKVYSVINIIGLSAGAATSLIILLFVHHELSFDKFLPDSDRIYRVVEDRIYPDHVSYFTLIPGGFATVLPNEVPEVEKATRIVMFPNFTAVTKYEDKVFSENYFAWADSNFFEVLPFKLLKGNPSEVLHDPNTLVLTQATAIRYFGDMEPVGKTITWNEGNYEVVGVMEDVPENSHLRFDALGPSSAVDYLREPNYYVAGTYTYIKLESDARPENVERKFPALVEKYAAGQIERDLGVSFKKYQQDGNGYRYSLQRLQDIHLTSNRSNEIKTNGSATVVNVLVFIALLILIIAAINFVNLATARSTERAKEVGVRKVLGSQRKQLIAQFISESLLITGISATLSVVIVQVTFGYFNSLAQQNIDFDIFRNPVGLAMLLAVTVSLGILAGLYPAFYISALKPVRVLKGKFQTSSSGSFLRNGLVVFQFTISVVLISATLVVQDQLKFIQKKELGFDKENLLVINHNSEPRRSEALKNELRKLPGVFAVGAGNSIPGGYFYGSQYRVPGSTEIFTPKGLDVDDHFFSAMNLKILEGRSFGPEFHDSLSIILNEKAVQAMRLAKPVGTKLVHYVNPENPVPYTVVGVIEDFHFESLHTEIIPLVISSSEGPRAFESFVVTRLNAQDIKKTVEQVEKRWKEILPNAPFEYSFMDNRMNSLYSSEQTSGKLLTTFTGVAIVIACIGLFGLTAYMAYQRTKEIGVRKVLGASVVSIVNLLTRDFAKLVLIAMLLGIPTAWIMMREWLSTFAYRTTLNPITFLTAGAVVVSFMIITVSYQSITSARANPVDSLKEE